MRTFLLLLSLYVWEIQVVLSQDSANGEDCLPRSPDDFGCTKAFCSFTDPADCNKYITCVPEKNCGPRYMGYKYTSCPHDQFYDDTLGECVRTFKCPSNPDIKQTAENVCDKIGAAFADEKNCRKFIACASDGDTWYFKEKECPPSDHFNKETMKCEKGECEGCLQEAPSHADCQTNGVGSKFSHEDCDKFYTCETNVAGCGSSDWGSFEHNCPIGQFFDIKSKECVASEGCPRRCPPKSDNQTLCTRDGEELVSADCREVTICKRVETCDQNSFESYWTTETMTCSPDEFYNARLRKCVKTHVCPQVFQDENCPGAVWEYKGTDGYNFDNSPDLDHFICRGMLNSTTLGVGVFYRKTQKCYLAPLYTSLDSKGELKDMGLGGGNWGEYEEYELLSSASTGLFLKRRESAIANMSLSERPFLLTPYLFAVVCKRLHRNKDEMPMPLVYRRTGIAIMTTFDPWALKFPITFLPDFPVTKGYEQFIKRWKRCDNTGEGQKNSFQHYLACKP